MGLNIISDSSIGLNSNLMESLSLNRIPFFLELDGEQYLDDDNFDTYRFVEKMVKSDNIPKSAAPSPKLFMEALREDEENFIVTISSKLSASYQNALIGVEMAKDRIKNSYVVDSKSAVTGLTLIGIKLREYEGRGFSFEEKKEHIEEYIENMETIFVLEDFTNLIKNGRARKLAGAIFKALKITPIARGDNGSIELLSKARGMKKASDKIIDSIKKSTAEKKKDVCVIAHVLNEEIAEYIKGRLEELKLFTRIEIVEPSGLGALYANKGGIVVSF